MVAIDDWRDIYSETTADLIKNVRRGIWTLSKSRWRAILLIHNLCYDMASNCKTNFVKHLFWVCVVMIVEFSILFWKLRFILTVFSYLLYKQLRFLEAIVFELLKKKLLNCRRCTYNFCCGLYIAKVPKLLILTKCSKFYSVYSVIQIRINCILIPYSL